VSITLQDLLRWGVVKKISPLGKRRDYYVAEHDVWKMIRKVFREREKTQMENVQAKLQNAMGALAAETNARPDLKSKRTCQFQKVRIEDLLAVTRVAVQLLDSFINDGKMDVAPIFSVLKPYNQLAIGGKTH
jgi:DNA-binding transcriptional regulator GbsR (MarR family)